MDFLTLDLVQLVIFAVFFFLYSIKKQWILLFFQIFPGFVINNYYLFKTIINFKYIKEICLENFNFCKGFSPLDNILKLLEGLKFEIGGSVIVLLIVITFKYTKTPKAFSVKPQPNTRKIRRKLLESPERKRDKSKHFLELHFEKPHRTDLIVSPARSEHDGYPTRLATFRNFDALAWHTSAIYLAESGFIYDSRARILICHRCHREVSRRDIDSNQDLHADGCPIGPSYGNQRANMADIQAQLLNTMDRENSRRIRQNADDDSQDINLQ